MTFQQAPFSFHCRICYERLNLTDRPPIVLPCGHTYICQVCAQRLTRCMECRVRITPLAPVKKPQPTQPSNTYPHGHNVRKSYRLRQQEQRQNYYLQKELPIPTTVHELHAVLKETAVEPKPALPKNVVLMSLMEAAEQKQVLWTGKDDQDGYESGDDDPMVISGMKAMTSTYGTYVVKAKEGLWVYDVKPTCSLAVLPSPAAPIPLLRTSSLNSKHSTGKNGEEDLPPALPLSRIPSKQLLRRSSRPISPSTVADPVVASGSYSDSSLGNISYKQRFLQNVHMSQQPSQLPPKPVQRLLHGQTVQIVLFQDSVAQLARGGGYIRVEEEEDLVKVGEPTDEACRIEGIIFSLAEEKKQCKSRINHLHKVEKYLQGLLRKLFLKEAEEAEQKRQQTKLEQQQRMEKDLLNTSTASKTPSVVEELLAEDIEEIVPYRDVTPPSTPPPQLLEMSPSGISSETETPGESPRGVRRRSPPFNPLRNAPTKYQYDMPDGQNVTPVKTVSDDIREEKKESESGSPTTWEEDIFNQGCDLFFCATMPLCIGHNTTSAVMAGDFPTLHPNSSILATNNQYDDSPYRSNHYVASPSLERADSYDGEGSYFSTSSTVGSGGVDFSTGLSGHTGMSRGIRRRGTAPRKQVRMMSQHDGIAHVRRQRGKGGGASVVSMGGSSRASVVTL